MISLNENNAELIGVIAGDGHIHQKNNKYRIGFAGHLVTDKEYFGYLQSLIKKEWEKDGKIVFRENKLQMIINSKEVCLFLINDLKMPYGKGKSLKIEIPELILKDWILLKRFIRGIVDTDGTVFVSKKPRIEKYPSIEITSISKKMAEQIKSALEIHGFRVSKIWSFEQKMSDNLCYRFGLYGQKNLRKWLDEISFSNPFKLERAESYLK
ncbi:MAG: LAGLIDADG family homing endonuclease [archaeon]